MAKCSRLGKLAAIKQDIFVDIISLAEEIYVEPKDRELFLAKILKNGFIKNFEAQLRRKDGSQCWGSATAQLVKGDDGGVLGIEGLLRDISVQKTALDELSYQAIHDRLTGLVNRYEFEKRVSHLLADIQDSDDCHAMCFMDLDQFKVVNDTSGHVAGDPLLHKLGPLLRCTISKRCLLCRESYAPQSYSCLSY